MCFHASKPSSEKLRDFLTGNFTVEKFSQKYHVSGFTNPLLPVATNANAKTVKQMQWGLIPFWIKDNVAAKEIAVKTLNAKSETIFTTPSFRDSIIKKRCLIFLDGFYEWEHAGRETIPYYIYMQEHRPFAVGGVWAEWKDAKTGELIETCSIITTPANELMSKIHNLKKRMPLILEAENWPAWLSDESVNDEVQALMLPLPDGRLKAHRVSKLIASRTADTNVPQVQDEFSESLF